MIIVNCRQGDETWHRSRCGVITASNFNLIRASQRLKTGANKGEYNEKAQNYAFRLAVERISGQPLDEGFETWAMKRGHELEEAARIEHESRAGILVDLAGFVLTDDGKYGASADGLIDDDGGCEYKCLVSPERIRRILLEDDLSEFEDQIQGCMWATGRSYWHFCLYCPALEPIGKQLYMKEVKRNNDFIAELEQDLMTFEKLVSLNEQKLRNGASPQ